MHPDLRDRLLAFADFTGGRGDPYDDSGHGTHVCGIVCGTGRLSAGRYRGIAPGAGLVVGKVLDGRGDGLLESMLDGVDWVLRKKDRYGIRILNISVGMGGRMNREKEERLKDRLERAWRAGLAVVCAAGNNGPAYGTVSDVAKSRLLITVGCHDGAYFAGRGDNCAAYSARGDRLGAVRKPDIVAPGTAIVSCDASVYRRGMRYVNGYTKKSGTSMATPIVSGALALLFEQHPEYDNETAKHRLLSTAGDLGEPWAKQGWGMVDIGRLLRTQ